MTFPPKHTWGAVALLACSASQLPMDAATVDESTARDLTVDVISREDGAHVALAAVVLELHGQRVEATTGSDGRAVFEDLEFAGATASVTAVASGLRVISKVGVEEGESFVELRAGPLVSGVTAVQIEGTAQGMVDQGNDLTVSTTVPVGGSIVYRSVGPSYALEVEPNRPFNLVAFETREGIFSSWGYISSEVVQAAVVEHSGVKAPAVINCDFVADAATTESFGGTMVLPRNPDSPFRTDSSGFVMVGEPGSVIHLAEMEWIERTATGDEADFGGKYVRLGNFQAVTTYEMSAWLPDAGDRRRSRVVAQGYPPSWGRWEFLEAPEVTSAVELHPLRNPITWKSYDTSTAIILEISGESGPLWDVIAPGDAESLTVPHLPPTVDEEELLGTAPLAARVVLCEVDDSLGCRRAAVSRAVELVP